MGEGRGWGGRSLPGLCCMLVWGDLSWPVYAMVSCTAANRGKYYYKFQFSTGCLIAQYMMLNPKILAVSSGVA